MCPQTVPSLHREKLKVKSSIELESAESDLKTSSLCPDVSVLSRMEPQKKWAPPFCVGAFALPGGFNY